MSAFSIPWTDGLGLRCTECEWTGPPTLRFDGCPTCGGTLETTYVNGAHLPIAPSERTDLGLLATPLVAGRTRRRRSSSSRARTRRARTRTVSTP